MRYDMHVHLAVRDEGDMEKYELYSKMANLDIVGFVIHYSERTGKRELRRYRDAVESMNMRSLAGLEIYYPSTIPRGFDFYIIHFSSITLDAEILRNFERVIIAHPFQYGMKMDESSYDILERNGIAVECNSAHYLENLSGFYRSLRARGIAVPFGSDAHTPEEMGSGFEALAGICSPFREVREFLGL